VFFDRSTRCEHCNVFKTISERIEQRWTVKWIAPDHRPEEFDVNAYPIPGATSGSPTAVVVWQDRTEERRLENSLMQAGKLAAIGQLAAGVAHEINNPLTAINANAQMLQMTIPPDHEDYESVELIARAGERAAQVVRGLLDFARETQYTFETADINASISQALDLVSYQLTANNIEIVTHLTQDLPAIEASLEHLQSVWLNLLLNARDALQESTGQKVVTISTEFDTSGNQIRVAVHDTGRGMSSAETIHIFEPFYTTKAPGKGTGLGLATSHRIVEQHGGQINVTSTPGKGTIFTVHIPISDRGNQSRSSVNQ
jgi:two-component system NtrC family sensor kinase